MYWTMVASTEASVHVQVSQEWDRFFEIVLNTLNYHINWVSTVNKEKTCKTSLKLDKKLQKVYTDSYHAVSV